MEFFAALLSTEIGNTDNIVKYVKDAQKRKIEVRPPHVNFSDYLFSCRENTIYFGLGAIKGVGESAVQAILDARENHPNKKFESLEDFFAHVEAKKLNKKVIECLIKAGAFEGFGYHRAQLLNGYQKFLDAATHKNRDKESGQVSLFDMDENHDEVIKLDQVTQWTRTVQLAAEKEVLGFYLSDHPLKGYDTLLKVWSTGTIEEILTSVANSESKEKRRVVIAGLVSELREVITKKGTRMAFGKIEDLTGQIEVIFFPDTFAVYEGLIKCEKPLLLGGNLESENSAGKNIVDTANTIEGVFAKTKKVVLHLDKLAPESYDELYSILMEFEGNVPVELQVFVSDLNRRVVLQNTQLKGLQIDSQLFEKIQSHIGSTNFFEIQMGS